MGRGMVGGRLVGGYVMRFVDRAGSGSRVLLAD